MFDYRAVCGILQTKYQIRKSCNLDMSGAGELHKRRRYIELNLNEIAAHHIRLVKHLNWTTEETVFANNKTFALTQSFQIYTLTHCFHSVI